MHLLRLYPDTLRIPFDFCMQVLALEFGRTCTGMKVRVHGPCMRARARECASMVYGLYECDISDNMVIGVWYDGWFCPPAGASFWPSWVSAETAQLAAQLQPSDSRNCGHLCMHSDHLHFSSSSFSAPTAALAEEGTASVKETATLIISLSTVPTTSVIVCFVRLAVLVMPSHLLNRL